jgi:hypothetical protein
MTADQIASQFAAQGYANRWLSVKQTSWLLRTAHAEMREFRGSVDRRRADGILADGRSWGIVVMPNGCSILRVTDFSAEVEARNAAEYANACANDVIRVEIARRLTAGDITQEYADFMLSILK